MEGYRLQDPPPEQKLAAPAAVIHTIARTAAAYPTHRKILIANLCIVAFYVLLRSVEYCDTGKKDTRTTPFCLGDITFWHGPTCINAATITNPHLLTKATAATLHVTNQKNGFKGQTIHQEATGKFDCPVKALANIVQHLRQHTNNPDTPISTYWTKQGTPKKVTSATITETIRKAATDINLAEFGINPKQLSSHSLRSGGAMALHLGGASDSTIRKMGRWKSDAFLTYLHAQISCFNKGLSTIMSRSHTFINVARPAPRQRSK